jgi:hypothetical protein
MPHNPFTGNILYNFSGCYKLSSGQKLLAENYNK